MLRLECSIDCISGSVGHQQNIFSLSAFILKNKFKTNFNWASGSRTTYFSFIVSVNVSFEEKQISKIFNL